MAGPEITDTSERAALGVRIVDTTVHDTLRYLFRPRERRDLGIDGEIELVKTDDEGKRRGTGRLIAVQIKCGESFFEERDGDSFVFRGDSKHLAYWLDFSIPVLVVICNPITRDAYWVEITPGAVTRLDKGWKIGVPQTNVLAQSAHTIFRIAERSHIASVIDLTVQTWAHARHAERVEFCGIYSLPRDYHWYHHLLQIGETQVMLHSLYARYGQFEVGELQSVIQYLPGNLQFGKRLILCLVAESPDAFAFSEAWQQLISAQPDIQTVRLLFDRNWAQVSELDANGNLIHEYYRGDPTWVD